MSHSRFCQERQGICAMWASERRQRWWDMANIQKKWSNAVFSWKRVCAFVGLYWFPWTIWTVWTVYQEWFTALPRHPGVGVSEFQSRPVTCVSVFPCFSPNALAIRGSYFKYRGEGSQIYWIRFGGAVGQGVVRGVVWRLVGDVYGWVYKDFLDSFWGRGCRAGCHLRCRLTFIWSCVWAVWVSVRRSFGFVFRNIYARKCILWTGVKQIAKNR